MQTMIIAAITAFVTSVICCEISTRSMIGIVDEFVTGMIDLAKETIKEASPDKNKDKETED